MHFRDLNLRTKQFLGFGLVLILMTGAGFRSINRMQVLKEELDETSEFWLPRALVLSDIQSDAISLRNSQLQFAMAGEEENRLSYAEDIGRIIERISESQEKYLALSDRVPLDVSELQMEQVDYEKLDGLWENYLDLTFSFIDLLEGDAEVALELLNGEMQASFYETQSTLDNLILASRTAADKAALEGDRTIRNTRRFAMFWLLLGIVASTLIALRLVYLIVKPIEALDDAASKVASGNLNLKLSVKGKDEVGRLTKSFNRMTASLRDASKKDKEQQERLELQHSKLESAHVRLKGAQEKLVQSEKMASVGQLTAGIAHEINNPINFVTSNIKPLKLDLKDLFELLESYDRQVEEEQLQDRFEKIETLKKELDIESIKEEISDLLNGIEEGATRTSEIVKGLRNFSRLDEAELKLADINQGLESTLMLLRSKIKNRIEVVKDFEPVPEIHCYPGKLNQVFMNLLNNAAQAIEGEGKIFVSTSSADEKVVVSIRDTGSGMSPEVRNRIFEPFYTTKEVGQGTGLGLSIVYGIIEDHHGNIVVNSTLGEGTEFVVTLPI